MFNNVIITDNGQWSGFVLSHHLIKMFCFSKFINYCCLWLESQGRKSEFVILSIKSDDLILSFVPRNRIFYLIYKQFSLFLCLSKVNFWIIIIVRCVICFDATWSSYFRLNYWNSEPSKHVFQFSHQKKVIAYYSLATDYSHVFYGEKNNNNQMKWNKKLLSKMIHFISAKVEWT